MCSSDLPIFAFQHGGRTAAPVQVLGRHARGQGVGHQINLGEKGAQVILHRVIAFDDLGIAATKPAHLVTKRNVEVQRQWGCRVQFAKPLGIQITVDAVVERRWGGDRKRVGEVAGGVSRRGGGGGRGGGVTGGGAGAVPVVWGARSDWKMSEFKRYLFMDAHVSKCIKVLRIGILLRKLKTILIFTSQFLETVISIALKKHSITQINIGLTP